MAKPFKQSDGVLKWYQIRARLIWGIFLLSGFSYAAYLHLNDRGQGRLQLLSKAPALARWLQRSGLLQPLPQAADLDRRSLFRRVWLRFADSDSAIPVATAKALAKLLLPDTSDHAEIESIFADWQARASARGSNDEATGTLPLAAFVQCMQRCTQRLPDDVLYLACTEQLKVPALSFEAEAELKALFDFVVAANGGSALFTVPYLAALAEELGFAASEERARYFLSDTHAVRSKQVALRASDWVIAEASAYDTIVARRATALPTLPPSSRAVAPDSAVLLVRSHVAVPITSDEWVNFMADVMRSCSTEEIKSACEVFIYLQSARPT